MKDQKMSVFLIFILILKLKNNQKPGNPTSKLLIVNILMYINFMIF